MAVALNTTFGAASTSGGTTSSTPALPTNWAVGQLLVTYCMIRSPTATATVSAGWNLIGPFRNTDATNGLTCYLAWRVATSGQTAPVWTYSGTLMVIARTYSFTDAQALGTAGTVWTGPIAANGSTGAIAGVAVPTASAAVILTGAADDFGASIIAPTNWTSMGAHEVTTGSGLTGFPMWRAFATAATSPDTTVTVGPTASTQGIGLQIPVLQLAPVATSSLPLRHPLRRHLPLLVR